MEGKWCFELNEEEKLVIKRFLFTCKYPVNFGAFTAPIVKAAEFGINAGFAKTKRVSKREDLPEPRNFSTPGMILIEFYMGNAFLKDIDVEGEMSRIMVKDRRLSPHLKKIKNLSSLGIKYSFDELEEWKPKGVDVA